MLLLAARQEVTKKRAKTFPLGTPLAMPLFKACLGEKHRSFFCIARHAATTSGRYAKAKSFAGCQGVLDPLVHFLGSFFLE
jgi:hypothetical protein